MSKRHSVNSKGRLGRRALKRFLYSQMALRTGLMIALGKEPPLVRFTVEDDPPSVYLVFRVGNPARLAAALDLPSGIELAPIVCIEGEEPQHYLTLNVYRVSGLTNGIRAEWSAYVADADGVPRYMVVDARASNRSMDPVDVLTKPSRVEHRRTGSTIKMTVGDAPSAFHATFDVPDDLPPAVTAREWSTANDYIYWRNGVCDRTFYDAGMADADQVALDPSTVDITDNSEWAAFVEPTPAHVLVFGKAIEFVVSPWWNIEDLD